MFKSKVRKTVKWPRADGRIKWVVCDLTYIMFVLAAWAIFQLSGGCLQLTITGDRW
jgi:hypothetical protein